MLGLRTGFLASVTPLLAASLPACSAPTQTAHAPAVRAHAPEPKKVYIVFGTTGFIAFPPGTKAEPWTGSDPSVRAKKVTLGGVHVQNGIVFGPGDLLFFKDQNAPELIRAIPKSKTTVKGLAFSANQAMDFVDGKLSAFSSRLAQMPEGKLEQFRIRPSSLALGVNTNATEHYVTEKSERDGLLELQKISDTSAKTETEELEEAWCFVRGNDEDGQPYSLWFEVGVDETHSGVSTPGDAWLHITVALGGLHFAGVDKLMSVHYHPVPHEKTGSVDWGTSYPSPTDLGKFSVIAERNLPPFLGMNNHEKVTATRSGIWRQKWIGPLPDPDDAAQGRLLDDHANKAWRHLLDLAPKAYGRDMLQPGVFSRFADIYSNTLIRLSFEPAP